MSNAPYQENPYGSSPLAGRIRHELAHFRKDWWWFLVLGISMIVLGLVAISYAYLATFVTVVFFGLLLLVAGVEQIVTAFWTGRWGGFLLHLFAGILYGILGLIFINEPAEGALALTLVMGVMFMVTGAFRIVAALSERFSGWGWPLLSGVISMLLGLMIYKKWPEESLWIIGLFVGIELVFNGFAWLMFSLGLKSMPERSEAENAL